MNTTARPMRPRPLTTADSDPFWDAVGEHRLVIEQCTQCGRYQHPPRPMCPACHSLDHTWPDMAGTGQVYSYTVLHHPQHPAFDYPLPIAAVDLDEGPRVVANLVDVDPSLVHVGMRVTVDFVPTADDGTMIVFRPVPS